MFSKKKKKEWKNLHELSDKYKTEKSYGKLVNHII